MTPLACHCSNQELLVPTRDVYCPPPPSACRYGENPHQKAAFYKDQSLRESAAGGVATSTVHWGKEMSYNNYLVCVWGGEGGSEEGRRSLGQGGELHTYLVGGWGSPGRASIAC